MTALMLASIKGRVKVVSTLLQRGACVDIKNQVYLSVVCRISASYTCIVHLTILAATKT